MHLERETRSLHSEGKHSGHRARKDVYRDNRTGKDNSGQVVNHVLKSVVREIRMLRSVGEGAG